MRPIWLYKLKELKKDEKNWMIWVDKLYRARVALTTEEKKEYGIIPDYLCEKYKEYLADCRRQLKRFEWLNKLSQGKVSKKELRIEDAKAVPIGDLVHTKKTGSSGGRDYYLCNLHPEKTGSLVVYKNSNTWHCYGCHAGSDSIDMVMQLNKIDFINAVKYLTS